MTELATPWLEGPVRAVVAPSELHLWRSGLEGPAGDGAMLSGEERGRAERYKLPVLRSRFVNSRRALRTILSRYTGEAPAALRFEKNPNGKPRLMGESRLMFNLSHSQDVQVVAVTADSEVGVDVERMDGRVQAAGIARRFFFPEEQDEIASSPRGSLEAFFQVWTAKEAVMKATSDGLAAGLSQVRVTLDPLGVPGMPFALASFVPAAGFAGCVAARAITRAVHWNLALGGGTA